MTRASDGLLALARAQENQLVLTLIDVNGDRLNETYVELRGTPMLTVLATSTTATLAASAPARLTLHRVEALPTPRS
jgi:hypothetical protein